ncbi:MAG: hypothetical protein MRJ97_05150 [Candidatus Nitrosocosmicus sp.]|nr:hypothetical protein [Candidatus Nitrosocosmicus sp.]
MVGSQFAGPGLTDSDKDGKLDNEDNFPSTVNPDQKDSDGDGIGDACEIVDSTSDSTTPPPPSSFIIDNRINNFNNFNRNRRQRRRWCR